MTDRLQRADDMLADQHARLSAVIDSDAPPEVRSLAEHYLRKVLGWQGLPDGQRDLAAAAMGPNLYGKSIDDVCWQAEFHAARSVHQREDVLRYGT